MLFRSREEGFLLPIGGYKGYGLSMVFGLLAGTLNGAAMGRAVVDFNNDDTSVTNTGQAIAIDRQRENQRYLPGLALPEADISTIRSVYSHVHALGQCRKIIRELGLKPVVTGVGFDPSRAVSPRATWPSRRTG